MSSGDFSKAENPEDPEVHGFEKKKNNKNEETHDIFAKPEDPQHPKDQSEKSVLSSPLGIKILKASNALIYLKAILIKLEFYNNFFEQLRT